MQFVEIFISIGNHTDLLGFYFLYSKRIIQEIQHWIQLTSVASVFFINLIGVFGDSLFLELINIFIDVVFP